MLAAVVRSSSGGEGLDFELSYVEAAIHSNEPVRGHYLITCTETQYAKAETGETNNNRVIIVWRG